MGRIVKFSVVNEAGAGEAGQTIKAGDSEVTTGASGLAQVLLDDGDTVVTINGKEVYRGSVTALKPLEVFTTAGQRRA